MTTHDPIDAQIPSGRGNVDVTLPDHVAGIGEAVIGRRRETDRSVTEVARAARVPRHVIDAAERGDPVSASQAVALLDALGIDPTPWVPDLGPSRVAAVDGEHSRRMTYLAETAEGRGDAVLVPDVAAYLTKVGYDAHEHARAMRDDDADVPWQNRAECLGTVVGAVTAACGIATMIHGGACTRSTSAARA